MIFAAQAEEGLHQRARGQAVPLHELARPRGSVPPAARSHLHPEVGGSQPGRRRPDHRPLQRRRRQNGNVHRCRRDA